MKKLLKKFTKSGPRRLLAFAITALMSGIVGVTLDSEMVALGVQALITLILVATGDDEAAETLIDDLSSDAVLKQLERK